MTSPTPSDLETRLLATCPACGLRSILDGRCSVCGAPKNYGTPWLVPGRPKETKR